MIHSSADAKHAAAGGAVAGTIAGGILTALTTGLSFAKGEDVWYGVKGAAAPFLGDRALLPGFDLLSVPLGLATHLAISAMWGVLFGLAFHGRRKGVTVAAGVLWGFVVWAGMYYLVLPVVGLAHMTREAPLGRVIVYHLAFSVPLAVAYLPFQPKLIRPRLHLTRAARPA